MRCAGHLGLSLMNHSMCHCSTPGVTSTLNIESLLEAFKSTICLIICWLFDSIASSDLLPLLQKYRVDMPGSNSAFIPTINAITTSQDLQWMVQPTVITSMSNPYSRSHPYSHHLTNGPGLLGHNTLARPGVIRSIGDARGRRKRDEQVTFKLLYLL